MQRSSLRSRFAQPIVIALLVASCAPAPTASPTASAAVIPSPTAEPPVASPTTSTAPASSGPLVPPEVLAANTTPEAVSAISAGWGICAIREADGSIVCWNDGQRPPEGRFVAIDSNDGSTCAIRVEGTLACWGMLGGEVPDGTYRAVSVSQNGACAIRQADDRLTCWSAPDEDAEEDEEAAEEDPDEESFEAVPPPEGPVRAVSKGDEVDCAIVESGELACWAGYAGDIPPVGDDRYQAVDLPCAITVAGALRCLDSYSESGSVPPRDGTFRAVSAMGLGRGCAIRDDGTLACWGDEGSDDATANARQMRTPPGVYTSVTVGETVACATRPDGVAICWGEDDEVARPAPTMRFDAPLFATEAQVVLRWDAAPAFGSIAGYDIDLVTAWNDDGIATGFEPWQVGTTSTRGVFEGTPGKEYCWRARATDTVGAISEWGGGCTTMPHDDSAFQASGGWSTVENPRYYAGRALRATERGARLTIDVDAFGLALLATRCPDCGSFRVVSGGRDPEWSDTVDLSTGKREDRALVWHWDNGQEGFWTEEGTGHVVIEVTSNGKPVIIDGLLQGPSLDEEGFGADEEDVGP